jgi:hypothetical protein
MHEGKMYFVTLAELNPSVYTREASRKLANEWWRGKLAQLNQPTPQEKLQSRWHAEDLKEKILEKQRETAAMQVLLRQLGEETDVGSVFIDALDSALTDAVESKTLSLNAVEEMAAGKPVVSDKSIGALCGRFLAHEQARGKKANTFADVAYFITKLQAESPILAPQLDATALNGRTVTDVYTWLRNKSGWSPHSQHKAFNHFRRWLRFMAGEEVISLPLNVMDRVWTFNDGARKIQQFPTEEVRGMLATIPERLRLYGLLGLNCGMYGVDMGQILHMEYQNGRIRRKRSKTERHESVPEVEYLLWPETVALLEKYRSKHPLYVLTSKKGTPLWTSKVVDGEHTRVDLIGTQWRRKRSNRPTIPLNKMRSIAATLLKSENDHRWCYDLFLGQAAAKISDRHYAADPQAAFDRAILWLRSQLLGVNI